MQTRQYKLDNRRGKQGEGHGGGHSIGCMCIFDLKDHSTGVTDILCWSLLASPTSDGRRLSDEKLRQHARAPYEICTVITQRAMQSGQPTNSSAAPHQKQTE